MAKNEIHLFDSGVSFEIQMLDQDDEKYSLADTNVLQFRFQKPDKSIVVREGVIIGNPINGVAGYTTTPEDFDQTGTWKYQIYIEKGPSKLSSDIVKFRVYPNI
jgi:hypothetical protein